MGGNDNRAMLTTTAATDTMQGALRLTDWGVIRAQGPDAASFLHGQLTQDVTGLLPGQARLAGYCSPKGRLLASFVLWRADEQTLLLACSTDLLPAALKRLQMFVLRAKCKLSDASGELALWGVAAAELPVAPGRVERLESSQWIGLQGAGGRARALVCMPADAHAPVPATLSADAWAWLEVMSGVPRITAATAEQFVPQMVNLEALDGVNFRKGCYPGQEVVARSQYRGTLKRRMFLFESAAAARPGDEVFHSSDPDQPAGMVVNAASFAGRHIALVELKLAVLDAGSLHLGSAQGATLTRLPLPYELPTDQD
jgi:folate-binding protein YgfZ